MYIRVKVTPGARKESFVKIKDDTYEVSVREKAEMNRANVRVRELLAENLGLPAGRLRLISGHHSQSKIFSF